MTEIQELKEKIKDSQSKLNYYLFNLGLAFAVIILTSYNIYVGIYPVINGIFLGILLGCFSFIFHI